MPFERAIVITGPRGSGSVISSIGRLTAPVLMLPLVWLAMHWPEEALVAMLGVLLLGGVVKIARWCSHAEDRRLLVWGGALAFLARVAVAYGFYYASLTSGGEGFLTAHDDRYWFAVGEAVRRELAAGASLLDLLTRGVWYEYLTPAHPGGVARSIGYGLFEALVFALHGNLLVLNLLNCFLGTLTALVAYSLARRIGDPPAARIAFVVVAVSEGLLWSAVNLRDAQLALLISVGLLLAVKVGQSNGRAGVLLVLLLPYLYLLRPVAALAFVVGVVVVVLAIRRPGLRPQLVLGGLVAAGAAGVMLLTPDTGQLMQLLGKADTADLAAARGAVLNEFHSMNQGAGTFSALYSRFGADPVSFFGLIVPLGSALAVLRPPLIPGPDEWVLYPSRIIWFAGLVPPLAVACWGVLREARTHGAYLGLLVAYGVALVATSPMTAFFGPRYIHAMIAVEAALIGFGFGRMRRARQVYGAWLLCASTAIALYYAWKAGAIAT